MSAMAVLEEIDAGGGNTDLDAFQMHLSSICTKHYDELTRVVIERRNRGAGSGRISSSVKLKKEPDDDKVDEVAKLVDKVVDIIRRDANLPRGRDTPMAGKVGPWQGAAVLLNENKSGTKQVLDEAPLSIVDPEVAFSSERALGEMTNAMVKGYAEMSKATGNLHRWSAKREKQQSKRDRETARLFKEVGKMMRGASKYDYKARKREARRDERVEEARASSSRSKYFWQAVTETGESWHDVAKAWTDYFTAPREPGAPERGMPRAPTKAELDKVLGSIEDFERRVELDGEQVSVKTLLAEIIVERDVQRRKELAQRLLALFNRAPAVGMLFKARVVGELGAERARELAAWLELPV